MVKAEADLELDLLLHLDDAQDRTRLTRSAIVSVALHVVLVLALPFVPLSGDPAPRAPEIQVTRRVTPLAAPPREEILKLTQKAPNTTKPSDEVNLENLLPHPKVVVPKKFSPSSPSPPPQVAALPAAPKIELPAETTAPLPPQGLGNTNIAPPAPTPQPAAEKPKLAFETVPATGRGQGNINGGPTGAIQIPKTNIEEIARSASRTRGTSGIAVGDGYEGSGGIEPGIVLPRSPAKTASNIELLSDPQGVDFRPYLIKVLAAVRRNWFAVIPESARFGRTGKVVIQFAIARSGSVPKLVIVTPSGADPLDRAAVAGISASNPFPPLPPEFKGDVIRLQFAFSYNVPGR